MAWVVLETGVKSTLRGFVLYISEMSHNVSVFCCFFFFFCLFFVVVVVFSRD